MITCDNCGGDYTRERIEVHKDEGTPNYKVLKYCFACVYSESMKAHRYVEALRKETVEEFEEWIKNNPQFLSE